MYKILFTDSYIRIAEKWIKKHPDLKKKYYNTIELLEINPFHNSLRLHKLSGNLSELYSVSIDMKYRVIIDFVIDGNEIIPLSIGDHSIYK